MKIYFEGKELPADEVIEKITDEWISDGNYCDQTIIDLRDYALGLEARVRELEKGFCPKCKEENHEDKTTS